MNDGTNNAPKRPTPIPTEAQKDGTACIRCGLDFTTCDVPSVPAGMWNSSQMFRCRECKGVTEVDTPADEKGTHDAGTPEPVTAPTSAMWPGEPDSVREAAEINRLLEQVAHAAGQLFALRFGARTGTAAYGLTRRVLCDAVSDCRLDPDEVAALFLALKRGDLATVEEALR